MTLAELNVVSPAEGHELLLHCCGSEEWVEEMLACRPYKDQEACFALADSIWWSLDPAEWLHAFSAHPRIGEKKLSDWCAREQSGVDLTASETVARLALGNAAYEERFGWIFLVNASGKSGSEMLAFLEERLTHESAAELRVAAGEQAQITRLRLKKLLET